MDVAGMWRGCGLDVAVLTPIYRFHMEPIYPLNKGCESQCYAGFYIGVSIPGGCGAGCGGDVAGVLGAMWP